MRKEHLIVGMPVSAIGLVAGLFDGCLAMQCSPVARAAIIYQDIPDVTLNLPAIGNDAFAGIDFLGDGSNEFYLTLTHLSAAGGNNEINFGIVGSAPQMRAMTYGTGMGTFWAVPFTAGQTLESGGTGQTALMYGRHSGAGTAYGSWINNPGTFFVGLVINGVAGPNYGWARITSTFDSAIPEPYLILHDFAFEGQPHVQITAGAIPAPGALALLGLGGVMAPRRRR